MPKISPSILSADLLNLEKEILSVEKAGADFHHIDVMDGHFVNNLSFGIPLIQALKKKVTIPLDVHIMVSNPDHTALDYANAGADSVTFHIEASRDPRSLIKKLHAVHTKTGLALNPDTPVREIAPFLEEIDLVLVMSVHPGFGGQAFLENALEKIRELHSLSQQSNLTFEISVDGGINLVTAKKAVFAGATRLVAGTYIYQAKDKSAAISNLKNA